MSISVAPASAEYGIWFRRTDVAPEAAMVPARWDGVQESRLCTLLTNQAGTKISTVEHIMAALAGCGIHNALIDIDGPEVPILDGSSAPFVREFLACGVQSLDAPVRAIQVLRSVEVRDGDAVARIEPAENLQIDFSIQSFLRL